MVEETKKPSDPKTNPLLAALKNIPGLSIELPTKAFLYRYGEVSEEILRSGEIHIHPMSAKDEILLKSPDLLINGTAISKVIKRCVPGINDPMELYQPDVDAILMGLRIATYGEAMPIRTQNPFYDSGLKGSQKELDFNVNLKTILASGKGLESREECIIELETGQKALIQPMRIKLAVEISQTDLENIVLPEEDDARSEMFQGKMETLIRAMVGMIQEIDGITDEDQILEWFEEVPASIFERISEQIALLTELGPNLITEITDPVTKKKWETALPIDSADFFGSGLDKENLSK